MGNINTKEKAAYRHFAYLIRKGDALDVVFARFDDDKQTSLSGSDVWSALVLAHRAVGEYYDPTEKRRIKRQLSEVFLSTLLDTFDRHLTPKDVVTSFHKDPRFPLVPALDDIRAAMFGLIQPAGHAGAGTGGWELVDSVGTRLNVAHAAQLAVSSVQQQLRRVVLPVEPALVHPEGEPYSEPTSGGGTLMEGTSATVARLERETTYSWYRLDLANRSITDDAKRDALAGHLRWLASKLEDNSLDHQLLTLKYELMVATSPGLADELKSRADDIEARSSVAEEI